MEVSQGNEEEVEQIEQVQAPDIVGKTIQEAEKVLKENGFELAIENETEEMDKGNITVKEQTPKAGIIVNKGSKVNIKY